MKSKMQLKAFVFGILMLIPFCTYTNDGFDPAEFLEQLSEENRAKVLAILQATVQDVVQAQEMLSQTINDAVFKLTLDLQEIELKKFAVLDSYYIGNEAKYDPFIRAIVQRYMKSDRAKKIIDSKLFDNPQIPEDQKEAIKREVNQKIAIEFEANWKRRAIMQSNFNALRRAQSDKAKSQSKESQQAKTVNKFSTTKDPAKVGLNNRSRKR